MALFSIWITKQKYECGKLMVTLKCQMIIPFYLLP